MGEVQLPEVFTVDEVARATGLPREWVAAHLADGPVRGVAHGFIPADEAVRLGRRLRHLPPPVHGTPPDIFSVSGDPAHRRPMVPAAVSSLVHASLLGVAILLSTLGVSTAVTEEQAEEPARLVFLVSPGPGGGGGGGGLRNPLPAPRVERAAPRRTRAVTVPEVTPTPVVTTARRETPPARPTPAAAPVEAPRPSAPEPEPLPSTVLVAPVVAAASDARDREGVIDRGRGEADSQGAGSGGGAGTGQGTGNGAGLGSGIGEGSGGGTGGGPYRPGSGIEPPRLLREVKADYTDEARRRGVSGEVLLEIVIRADGSVGDVRIVRGLGSGLDQRAVAAVRQWRFAPARRQGAPVDVLVEVAVEFMLR